MVALLSLERVCLPSQVGWCKEEGAGSGSLAPIWFLRAICNGDSVMRELMDLLSPLMTEGQRSQRWVKAEQGFLDVTLMLLDVPS